MALEREMATYRRALPELLAAGGEGLHVLISGDCVVGVYPEREAALAAGYSRVGLVPFLVKQVARVEPVLHFTRDLGGPPHARPPVGDGRFDTVDQREARMQDREKSAFAAGLADRGGPEPVERFGVEVLGVGVVASARAGTLPHVILDMGGTFLRMTIEDAALLRDGLDRMLVAARPFAIESAARASPPGREFL